MTLFAFDPIEEDRCASCGDSSICGHAKPDPSCAGEFICCECVQMVRGAQELRSDLELNRQFGAAFL